MKKNILNSGIFIALLLIVACSNDNDNDEIANLAQLQADVEEITNTAMTANTTTDIAM